MWWLRYRLCISPLPRLVTCPRSLSCPTSLFMTLPSKSTNREIARYFTGFMRYPGRAGVQILRCPADCQQAYSLLNSGRVFQEMRLRPYRSINRLAEPYALMRLHPRLISSCGPSHSSRFRVAVDWGGWGEGVTRGLTTRVAKSCFCYGILPWVI